MSRLSKRPRLAIVVSHPVQHFCPMYRAIAADGRVELLVIFAEAGATARFDVDFNRVVKWQDDILDGYPSTVVKSPETERTEGVLAALEAFRPDVVYLHGYHQPYLKKSVEWAHVAGLGVLMTTDSELLKPRPLHVRLAKKFVLPRTFRHVDLFLTVGDENERYFEHYGVSRDRFLRVPFSIDSEYYDRVLANRDEVRRALRSKLGIADDEVMILNVAKLIPHKGQRSMIEAFAKALKATRTKATLVIAGDGPDRAALEEQIKPLGSAVRLPGFIGVDQLPEYYIASDLYAHPSGYDPHPLAVSEAIYCGLPIIASDRIGSTGATDDVQVGRNGWVFPFEGVSALAEILTKLIDDAELRRKAGAVSASIGPIHASDRIARLFVDGALQAMGKHRKD